MPNYSYRALTEARELDCSVVDNCAEDQPELWRAKASRVRRTG